ncbi:MAG: NigD-like protein [Mediterranea sp.]|jgi:hypothetical protein|nr:NigD-like protein [Mediterranea sp.]
MKKFKKLILLACVAITLPMLQACDDDKGYPVDALAADWATIRTTGSAFYLDSDEWGTCWPVNLNLGHYKAVDGKRALLFFSPIYDNFEGYDHAVKIIEINDALTKSAEKLTEENTDTLGNDGVYIFKGDMSVSNGYLNIIFQQNLPKSPDTKHRISLVADPAYFTDNKEGRETDAENPGVDADGYVHVELRYNSYGDTSGYYRPALVSFNLSPLNFPADSKGLKIKLNSEVNGPIEVTFDSHTNIAANRNTTNMDFSKMQLE